MKVVINACHGGFNLSPEAFMRYAELKGINLYAYVDVSSDNYKTTKIVPYTGQDTGCGIFSGPYFFTKQSDNEEELWNNSFGENKIERNDPCLVQTVEELGEKANGCFANLKIVEVPDDVKWHIAEYDGWEHVAEDHRTWG